MHGAEVTGQHIAALVGFASQGTSTRASFDWPMVPHGTQSALRTS
jgi:hypothetical protein